MRGAGADRHLSRGTARGAAAPPLKPALGGGAPAMGPDADMGSDAGKGSDKGKGSDADKGKGKGKGEWRSKRGIPPTHPSQSPTNRVIIEGSWD